MTTSHIPPIPVRPPADLEPQRGAAARRTRLGEELPIFCERCGYSLHGLPQARCEHCTLLQFICPECGHHQPINTLRPAALRIIGHLRAAVLVLIVLAKLVVIGWALVGWCILGAELGLSRDYNSIRTVVVGGQVVQRGGLAFAPMRLHLEYLLGAGLFAIAFGAVGRMLLLRWRRSVLVGLVLAALAVLAAALGAHIHYIAESRWQPPSPFNRDFLLLLGWAGLLTLAGAMVVWPVWVMLVTVFLPKKTAAALLDWQRQRPTGADSALARE